MAIKAKKGIFVFIIVIILMLLLSPMIAKVIDTAYDKYADSRNMDPLLWAIEVGEVSYVQEALDEGADVNKLTQRELTYAGTWEDNPLKITVEFDNHDNDIFRCLIENGADVNYIDETGESILMYVIRKCDYEKVKMLVDAGADLNYKTPSGIDLMMCAVTALESGNYIEENAYKIINFLADKGFEANLKNYEQFFTDRHNNCIEGMKTLDLLYEDFRDEQIDVKINGKSVLNDIYLNNTEKIIEYIDRYTQIDDVPFYVIGCCVANDNIDVLKHYYEKGGNLETLSKDGNRLTLLMIGAVFDSYDTSKFLLEHGADINQESEIIDEEGSYMAEEDKYMTAKSYAQKYDSKRVIELFSIKN